MYIYKKHNTATHSTSKKKEEERNIKKENFILNF